MSYSFNPHELFTKGVVYGEFFDVATDNLVGFSRYISDFNIAGSMNPGPIEGGPGNMLIMNIPDSSRLAFTARTTDDALENVALTIGQSLSGNGKVETSRAIVANANTLNISGAVAPYGGSRAVAYIISSSGQDKAEVRANSGVAHEVNANGDIQGFTAVSGNTYCVKYFIEVSSAQQLTVPGLFQPKAVRAHFAVNCYAKGEGTSANSGTIVKIRHYYIPYYFFTNPLNDAVNQTTNGSVDLSGNCLTYNDVEGSVCANNMMPNYCYIVDEFVDGGSTQTVQGIYFVGAGSGVSVAAGSTAQLTVKYEIDGKLSNISDMSQVTFTSGNTGTASFADAHSGVVSGVAAGSTTVTVSVTNELTGVSYSDSVTVTVT